jgi:hypothetical protein
VHPFTGLTAIGILPSGKAVWPVRGAAPDPNNPDDPDFTGEGEEDDDEEEEEDDSSSKSKKPVKKSAKDDDDEDEEEDDDPKFKASRQAKRYRLALRAEQQKNAEMAARLKALEDKDKDPDEVVSRDLTDARAKIDALTATNQAVTAQLAFFKTNVVNWVDPTDAFALADREGLFDDVIDEDGNVDARELRRGLRDLAKRKPHLVKAEEDPKARGRKTKDEDEEEDEEEPRSARPMNGNRRGKKGTAPTRAELAKKFPVLNRR